MYTRSPQSSVMDLVGYYEQHGHDRRRQSAYPQAMRPGSSGKLIDFDSMNDMALAQHAIQEPMSTHPRHPQISFNQSRIGHRRNQSSLNRRSAPQNLRIVPAAFAQFSSSPLNTSPGLADAFDDMIAYSPVPLAGERVMISTGINSPAQTPRRRGHTRTESQMSIASLRSDGSLFFPSNAMAIEEDMDGRGSFNVMTPPTSPKKRKSPTKSPVKAKDRPNYLDKAIMRETGVTQEQINKYIGDPLPSDPKNWRCLWQGCDHLAARKENIRAHVQTHLGDRPFKCPECHADFVRPHDFTRHYTTHVDSRDFKCPDCPQAFNRADALQRHRDRDFCNGPPPGSPSKVKRVMEAIDKKKDSAGRRTRKQAARKRAAARHQEYSDLSDDWLSSSSTGSPEYPTSDTGSPEINMSSPVPHHTTPVMSENGQIFEQSGDQIFTNTGQQSDAFLEQLISLKETGPSAISQTMAAVIDNTAFETPTTLSGIQDSFSLSPPASPETWHSDLPLKEFSPSQEFRRRDKGKQNLTPPASRESMLDFLSTGAPSINGGSVFTANTAPSLPDLSSANTSPIAFETVNDFDDLCKFSDDPDNSNESSDWFDWQGDFSGSSGGTSGAQIQEYRLSDFDQQEWLKRLPLLEKTDMLNQDELFSSL